MARIAIRAVIHVISNSLVVAIRRGLVVCVTGDTREDRVIRGVRVTIGAGCPFARVSSGVDREPRVIERRAQPGRGVMASCARRRESRRDVVGAGYVRIVRLVTGIAIGRSARVAAADVTAGARNLDMRTRQWERGICVIESRRLPRCRVVTNSAVGWKPGRDVVWRFSAIEVILVARDTSRTQACIFPARMTCHAGQRDVCTRQRELRLGMIELCSGPSRGRMADRAIGWEPRGGMHRIGRTAVVIHVAGCTITRRPRIFAIDVARGARHADVQPRQREFCHRVVIEGRTGPRRRVMAVCARGRESRRSMVRIISRVVVVGMA